MSARLHARAVLALAGACAIAIAIVSGCGVAGQAASPSLTSTPAPAPVSTASSSPAATATPIAGPGTARLDSIGQVEPPPASISVTVPEGWVADGFTVGKAFMDVEPALGVWQVDNRFMHPCTDHTLLSPAPGPGVEALIDALATQPGITAGPITDVTIDGYTGKSVELTTAGDACASGFHGDYFWLWASPDGDHRTVGQPEMDRIYALDVDGTVFTFFARIPPGTTPEDLATLEAIIDSIDIGPFVAPSASP